MSGDQRTTELKYDWEVPLTVEVRDTLTVSRINVNTLLTPLPTEEKWGIL
jgi:hypothetical protein